MDNRLESANRAMPVLRPFAEHLLSVIAVVGAFAFIAWLVAGFAGAALAALLAAAFLGLTEDPTHHTGAQAGRSPTRAPRARARGAG